MNQEQPLSCQEQLDQLKAEYEEFAYIVSHDLKAPLRAICNLSGWISEDLGDNLDPDVKHNISLLQNRAERMERMINAILSFSRVTRQDLDVREVNTEALVQELVGSGLATLQTSGLPTFVTYAKKLETVLANLIQNSIRYNDTPPAEISVSAVDQGSFYLFSVKDNGIGIAAEAHEKIFKMFYTVQPKDRQETLGSGLTIVKKIVTFVGGKLAVHSALGQGTEITFTWPKTVV